MKSRRRFFRLMGTTIGGTLFLPKFLHAMPFSGTSGIESNPVLVFIQMNGGNDGLNTFIPYDDPAYYGLRSKVAISKEEVLRAVSGMGFHPIMKGFSEIMQENRMSVVQNVGYPDPDRSHFRSIEIWQTASGVSEYLNTGWLGRALDQKLNDEQIMGAINFDQNDNLALRGTENHSITLKDPQSLDKQLRSLSEPDSHASLHQNLDFVRKLAIQSIEGADEIKASLAKTVPGKYPSHGLAKNLNWIARLIKGNLAAPVYYTSIGGFDTHANQLPIHQNRLKEVDESVKAFYDDLKQSGLIDRVCIVLFSEFGRRVKDNGSGTDHGAAAPVFVIGGGVRPGLVGKNPDLLHLDNGDLRYQIDFRSVYATLLNKKLGIDPIKAGILMKPENGIFG